MNNIERYYCKTCTASKPNLRASTGRVCLKNREEVRDEDFCSKHSNSTFVCECCGNEYSTILMPSNYLINDDSTGVLLCQECANKLGSCGTCKNILSCAFETDPSPLPKIVQKTIQRGNMQVITEIMNPERMKITCQQGCQCFHQGSQACGRNLATCPQYQVRLL